MLTKTEAEARVAKGAAHLDRVRPGWFDRIDVGTLTLTDPCGCIVGQLCGDYNKHWESLFDTSSQAAECGVHCFDADAWPPDDSVSPTFVRLQDAWIDAIAARRNPVTEAEHEPAFAAAVPTPERRQE